MKKKEGKKENMTNEIKKTKKYVEGKKGKK